MKVACPRCMPPGDPRCPYCGGTYELEVPWQPISNAPTDGTLVLGCYEGPWAAAYEQWRAPTTIAFRSFHPNAPGKKQWRDSKGSPGHWTHWQTLPAPPHDEQTNKGDRT